MPTLWAPVTYISTAHHMSMFVRQESTAKPVELHQLQATYTGPAWYSILIVSVSPARVPNDNTQPWASTWLERLTFPRVAHAIPTARRAGQHHHRHHRHPPAAAHTVSHITLEDPTILYRITLIVAYLDAIVK